MPGSFLSILNQVDPSNLLSIESGVKRAKEIKDDTLLDVSVYFLNNFTVSAIEPFLQFHGFKSGLDIQVGIGEYNVIHQALMHPESALLRSKPTILVISLMYDVFARPEGCDVCSKLQELLDLTAAKTSTPIVVNTFLIPPSKGSPDETHVHLANEFLRRYVKKNSKFHLCDWNSYLQISGYDHAVDLRYWYMAKAPFKPAFLSQYAAEIAQVARTHLGLSKKCLVLDCDGTLWGGVLGEEGLDGIKLHRDDYPGNVFYEVQKHLLNLRKKGVLLAINSKNNEADVFEAFEKHPHILLKKEHFTAHRINWNNKAENIVDLATELNLGLDSFVFLDDSDFECDLIQTMVPDVDVRQVPKKLFEYPDFVASLIGELFSTEGRTAEDASRAELYTARKNAEISKAEFGDIETYLRSLNIEVEMRELRPAEIARVSQLTQKTNQFNLNKTVYSEDEISRLDQNDDCAIYVMVVSDRFGKLGLTNVCIVKDANSNTPFIDTFLMSCRVFERNLEYAFLDYVINDLIKKHACGHIRSIFTKSPKNTVAENFYEKMNFEVEDDRNGAKLFVLSASDYKSKTYDYITRVPSPIC